jgi:hypothetical protein
MEDIQMDLGKRGCENGRWIELAQDHAYLVQKLYTMVCIELRIFQCCQHSWKLAHQWFRNYLTNDKQNKLSKILLREQSKH